MPPNQVVIQDHTQVIIIADMITHLDSGQVLLQDIWQHQIEVVLMEALGVQEGVLGVDQAVLVDLLELQGDELKNLKNTKTI